MQVWVVQKGASRMHCWKCPKRAFHAMQVWNGHLLASPHLRPTPPPSRHHSRAQPHGRQRWTRAVELAPIWPVEPLGAPARGAKQGSKAAGARKWREDEEAGRWIHPPRAEPEPEELAAGSRWEPMAAHVEPRCSLQPTASRLRNPHHCRAQRPWRRCCGGGVQTSIFSLRLLPADAKPHYTFVSPVSAPSARGATSSVPLLEADLAPAATSPASPARLAALWWNSSGHRRWSFGGTWTASMGQRWWRIVRQAWWRWCYGGERGRMDRGKKRGDGL